MRRGKKNSILNKWKGCANYKLRRNREKQKLDCRLKREVEAKHQEEKEERESRLQDEQRLEMDEMRTPAEEKKK